MSIDATSREETDNQRMKIFWLIGITLDRKGDEIIGSASKNRSSICKGEDEKKASQEH